MVKEQWHGPNMNELHLKQQMSNIFFSKIKKSFFLIKKAIHFNTENYKKENSNHYSEITTVAILFTY